MRSDEGHCLPHLSRYWKVSNNYETNEEYVRYEATFLTAKPHVSSPLQTSLNLIRGPPTRTCRRQMLYTRRSRKRRKTPGMRTRITGAKVQMRRQTRRRKSTVSVEYEAQITNAWTLGFLLEGVR